MLWYLENLSWFTLSTKSTRLNHVLSNKQLDIVFSQILAKKMATVVLKLKALKG